MNASDMLSPCPVCFGTDADKACYANVDTHSWANHDRCDAHSICWSCFGQYVEMKILNDGVWNIRCPGERCTYHLLEEDVKMAVKGSTRQDAALTIYSQLRQENCANRLNNVLACGTSNPSQNWILTSCQVCPNCHVIARREDGCNHIVCRCGCHLCFGCGVPYEVLDHLNAPGHAYRCSCTEESDEQASLGQWLGSLKALPPALFSQICLIARFVHQSRCRHVAQRHWFSFE